MQSIQDVRGSHLVNSEILRPLPASDDFCAEGGLDLIQAHRGDERVVRHHSHQRQTVLRQLLLQLAPQDPMLLQRCLLHMPDIIFLFNQCHNLLLLVSILSNVLSCM